MPFKARVIEPDGTSRAGTNCCKRRTASLAIRRGRQIPVMEQEGFNLLCVALVPPKSLAKIEAAAEVSHRVCAPRWRTWRPAYCDEDASAADWYAAPAHNRRPARPPPGRAPARYG